MERRRIGKTESRSIFSLEVLELCGRIHAYRGRRFSESSILIVGGDRRQLCF